MATTKKELLNELRAELKKQGFDASHMTDDELEKWLNEAGIEIKLNTPLN